MLFAIVLPALLSCTTFSVQILKLPTRRKRSPLENLSLTSATLALNAHPSQAEYGGPRAGGCWAALVLGHIATSTKPVTTDGRDLESFSEACNERLAA